MRIANNTIPPKGFVERAIESRYSSITGFYYFCGFWLLVALLAFIQDYVRAVLNDADFLLLESLYYKFFWLLFIPFSWLGLTAWQRVKAWTSPFNFLAGAGVAIVLSLAHLVFFALFLSFVTNLEYGSLHNLSFFIKQKLSTRLYIAISGHAVLIFIFGWLKKLTQKPQPQVQEYPKRLSIRIGKKSIMIDTHAIGWIKSDGAYVALHTLDKKYVIVNSLKNLGQTLDPNQFKRVHRSTIVNLEMVKELRSRQNGDYDVVLKEDTVIRLSRNYVKNVRGRLL